MSRSLRTANDALPTANEFEFYRVLPHRRFCLAKAAIEATVVIEVVVHATNVVSNAAIGRKGPLMALLVTEGFRGILTIKDEHRYGMFNPQIELPEQLVSREMTSGVQKRMLASGGIADVPELPIVVEIQDCSYGAGGGGGLQQRLDQKMHF